MHDRLPWWFSWRDEVGDLEGRCDSVVGRKLSSRERSDTLYFALRHDDGGTVKIIARLELILCLDVDPVHVA